MKCKTFDQILREMNFRPHLFDKWLEDKRLSNLEKKIVNSYKLLRNNQNQEIVSDLRHSPPSDIPFVNAQKHLVTGIALNNLSDFGNSEVEFFHAARIFEELEQDYYVFVAGFNQFILYCNLFNVEKMTSVLSKLRTIKLDSPMLKARLARCEFMYANITEDHPAALRWLDTISKIKEHLVEGDQIAQLVAEFVFYVKTNDLTSAQSSLESCKQYRKFHLSENFNYMKKMLDNLVSDTPIYAYKTNFCNTPLLWHQLQVIHFLEIGDTEQARVSWNHLQALAPGTYAEEFIFNGAKGLFSLCLDKHRKTQTTSKVVPALNLDGGLVDRLIYILNHSTGSIPKAELYEAIWGEHAETKEDLDKLTRLIYKAKQRYSLDIQSIKGSYLLKNKTVVSKAKPLRKA